MTAVDLYHKIAPTKKKIMCYDSASDILSLSNGWLKILNFYYDSGYVQSSGQILAYKVKSVEDIVYINVNNILVTSPEQTMFDLFKNNKNIQACLVGLLRYRDKYDKSLLNLKNFSEQRNFIIDWDNKLYRAIEAYEDYG